MSERAFLTSMLWFLSALVLGALFISAAAQGELTIGHLVFGFAVLVLVVIATPILARWKDSDGNIAKSKRQRIDHMLRDMSDEELVELRQRLATGNLSDDAILDYLGSDGELLERR
jgi:membrane protein implicated in regulation of membrane protease activity